MRSCLVLVLAIAACDSPGKKQTAADRDRCQQYHALDAVAAVGACTRLLQANDDRLVRHDVARYWRALAFMELQEWEEAKADFRKVLNPGVAGRIRHIEEL
jgi:Tfp pilus assembly protein PilF